MGKQWTLTQEAFDKLLEWFDSDRERAGKKYEEIRQSLVKVFAWRGFNNAEELADETINRVNQKIDELTKNYTGDPALYFHGVARKLMLESGRQERYQQSLPEMIAAPTDIAPGSQPDERERVSECLDKCLAQLSQADRELVLHYYQEAKQMKIDFRKEIAKQLKLTPNTLRVRVHRLRTRIHKCMLLCLQPKGSGETD
jgi:RNA polymerase sigma factor (sigma-70 family)